jgi:hypothetical protein
MQDGACQCQETAWAAETSAAPMKRGPLKYFCIMGARPLTRHVGPACPDCGRLSGGNGERGGGRAGGGASGGARRQGASGSRLVSAAPYVELELGVVWGEDSGLAPSVPYFKLELVVVGGGVRIPRV